MTWNERLAGRLQGLGEIDDQLIANFAAALAERQIASKAELVSAYKRYESLAKKIASSSMADSSILNTPVKLVLYSMVLVKNKPQLAKKLPVASAAENYFRQLVGKLRQVVKAFSPTDPLSSMSTSVEAAAVAAVVPEVREYLNKLAGVLLRIISDPSIQPEKVKPPSPPIHNAGTVAEAVVLNRIYSGPTPLTLSQIEGIKKIFNKIKQSIEFVIKSSQQSLPSGTPVGVRPIRSLEELPFVTPEEQALLVYDAAMPELSDYEVYKIVSGQALVQDRKAIVKPVIFIDKSGSMDSIVSIPIGENKYITLTRYELAAVVAAAIADATGAPLDSIYLFDYTLHSAKNIVESLLHGGQLKQLKNLFKNLSLHPGLLLLSITPGGGTNTTLVLNNILSQAKGSKHKLFLIITDAEDRVPRKTLEKAMEMNTFFILAHVLDEKLLKLNKKTCKEGYEVILSECIVPLYPDKTVVVTDAMKKSTLRKVESRLQKGVRRAAIGA